LIFKLSWAKPKIKVKKIGVNNKKKEDSKEKKNKKKISL
jgi:hypothetical protein